MDVREHHVNNIKKKLGYLKNLVELSGSLNLTDTHIHAEYFYRDLLNILGYSFNNINYDKQNTASIDLLDTINKEALQVTAQNDNDKIRDSITGFFKNSLYKDYSLKILLISKDAKDYRTDFSDGNKYKFDHKKDVIDIKRLFSEISNKGLDTIKTVSTFLDKEVLVERPKTELNEVETIMTLLEWLSDDENYQELDEKYICDPQKKIESRFKEYSDEFKEEFLLLMPLYCMSLPEAKKSFGLDGVKAEKISVFLIRISNQFLEEENGNPQKALQNLSKYFEEKITKNGIKVDGNAITYYLLDELIGCNIFSEEEMLK